METVTNTPAESREAERLRELVYDVGQAVTRLTVELGEARARIRVLEETLAWSGIDAGRRGGAS